MELVVQAEESLAAAGAEVVVGRQWRGGAVQWGVVQGGYSQVIKIYLGMGVTRFTQVCISSWFRFHPTKIQA